MLWIHPRRVMTHAASHRVLTLTIHGMQSTLNTLTEVMFCLSLPYDHPPLSSLPPSLVSLPSLPLLLAFTGFNIHSDIYVRKTCTHFVNFFVQIQSLLRTRLFFSLSLSSPSSLLPLHATPPLPTLDCFTYDRKFTQRTNVKLKSKSPFFHKFFVVSLKFPEI